MESDDEFIEYEIEVVDSSPPNGASSAREGKSAPPFLPLAKEQEKSLVGEGESAEDTTMKPSAIQPAPAVSESIETSGGADGKMFEPQAAETEQTIPQNREPEDKLKSGKGQAVFAQKSSVEKVSSSEEASLAVTAGQQVQKEPTATESAVVDQSNQPSIKDAIEAAAADHEVSRQEKMLEDNASGAKASSSASNRAVDAGHWSSTSEPFGPVKSTTSSNQETAITTSETNSTTINGLSAVADKVNQIPLNETSNSKQDRLDEANNKCQQVEPTNDRNDLTETLKEDNKNSNNEQERPSTPPANTALSKDEPTDKVVIGGGGGGDYEGKTATDDETKTREIAVTTTDNKRLLAYETSRSGGSQASFSTAGDEMLASQAVVASNEEGRPPLSSANHREGSSSKAETCEGRQAVEQRAKEVEWRFVREPYQMQIEPAQQSELLARLESNQANGELKPIQAAPVLAAPRSAADAREKQLAESTTAKIAEDSSLPSEQQQDKDGQKADPERVSISIEGADGEAVACALATKFSATMTGPADGDETGSEDLEWEFDNEPAFEKRQVEIKRDCDPRKEYELGNELGRGKFGTVYRCVEQSSGRKLAAKFVLMRRREDREDVEREIDIMSCLQHKRLLQLYAAFDDGHSEMCLITELVEGGELFERIIDDDFELTEKKAAIFMRQICEGIEYMHSLEIVHLDMKPENILCLSKTGNKIKLIDFGLARKLVPGEQLRVMFGTPDFAAPEVLSYDIVTPATDMWSIGVICYVLLSGLSPFMGDNDMETMANVTRATYDFEDSAFEPISDLAKDFIAKLLVREPAKRLKPSECLKHDWLQRGGLQLEASVRRASIAMLVSSGSLLEQQLASLTEAAAVAAATSSTLVPLSPPATGVQFASSCGLDSLTSSAMMLLGANSPPATMFSLDKRNLKKYVVRRKWHKTVHAIMALGRMGANLGTLRSSG